jgi:hypothetical protein
MLPNLPGGLAHPSPRSSIGALRLPGLTSLRNAGEGGKTKKKVAILEITVGLISSIQALRC